MKTLENIVESLQREFTPYTPDTLFSLIIFGRALHPDFNIKKEQIKVALVFASDSMGELRKVALPVSKFRKQGILFPYSFSKEFIQRSLDSFPLEFIELKGAHRLVVGQPPFDRLFIDDAHVRLQCERELKGKGLHLKSLMLTTASEKELAQGIAASREHFHRIYLGLLTIRGEETTLSHVDAARKVTDIFHLRSDVLVRIARGEIPQKDIHEFFVNYIEQIDKLSTLVDGGSL